MHLSKTPLGKILLLGIIFLMPATTFIIKEGDIEVGRWEENDGKTGTEIISQDTPNPVPAKEELTEYSDEPGYTATFKKTSEAPLVYWSVSGQVVDWIHLKGVGDTKIVFTGGPDIIESQTDSSGFFIVKLPQLKNSSYSFNCIPPSDYAQGCNKFKSFSDIGANYEARLQRYDGVMFGAIENFVIAGDAIDLKFAVKRKRLTNQEKEDYNRLIAAQNPTPSDH